MAGWGESLNITIFGESHGPAVGAVVSGFAPGIKINRELIAREMEKRSAKANRNISTPRIEEDEVEFLSGVYGSGPNELYSCGTPLCLIIKNKNTKSGDYVKTAGLARPGHADYTGNIKYMGYGDSRGGGHFSGRLTGPFVAVGAICKDILTNKGIKTGAHIGNIAGISDIKFSTDENELNSQIDLLEEKSFPVLSDEAGEEMTKKILEAKAEKDSVGGIIEAAITGVDAGIGEPFFSSLESCLSSLLYSIPGIKAVEFGIGFDFANKKGSEANDPLVIKNGKISFSTNNNGGINGGISNGQPIVFRCALKATPSIGRLQNTVDMGTMEEKQLELKGRHDPCIVHRAAAVVRAAAAIALTELYSRRLGYLWQKGEG